LGSYATIIPKGCGTVLGEGVNIAHYRIVKMLKKKEWNYSAAGIMDKTHIRFFAIKNIINMFKDANFEIVKIGNKIGASSSKKLLNKLFNNFLLDSIAEQYIVLAKK